MGFWFFMLAMDLLVPALMLLFGRVFMKGVPHKSNPFFGYRTARSMKNGDTWAFAHRYCGKLWFYTGLVLLPVSAAAMLGALGRTEETVATVGGIICLLQLIPLIGTVIPTERALKKAFDENGNRRLP